MVQIEVVHDEDKVYTKEQVWLNPSLYIFQNDVYDLTDFYDVHPGGRQVLQASGGIDVTTLFFSMHRASINNLERYLLVLKPFKVGKLSSKSEKHVEDNLKFETEFSKELLAKVLEVLPMNQWYAPRSFWIRTFIIIILTIVFETLWVIYGEIGFCIAVGFLHSQIGLSIQHDASHGALSKKSYLNDLFAYGADWIGNTRWLWFQQHIIGHHPNTNDFEHDPDAASAEPFLMFHPNEKKLKKLHRFQHWFMYPVLSMYGPSVVFNVPELFRLNHGDELPVEHNKFLFKQLLPSILLRFFYYLRIIVLPYFIGNAPIAWCIFGVNFVAGFCLTFVFVLSHNFVGSCRFPRDLQHQDWNIMQIETSCTYGGFISSFFTGGLNYQIEHHLFPRMSSWHYSKISPIVRQVCEKHGVNYTYFPTILHNMKSTLEYMRLNGITSVKVE